MCILLLFFGKFPSYSRYCIHQIRQWTQQKIFIISNDKNISKITNQFDNIILVDDSSLGEYNGENHQFRKTFFLEKFMEKYNEIEVFNLELDNLIYFNPEEYNSLFFNRELSYSDGLLFIRDLEAISSFNKKVIEYSK